MIEDFLLNISPADSEKQKLEFDVVDEEQCAEVVLRAADPLHASRALCDLATARGSMDNITALVVDLEPAAVAGGMA